MGGPLALAIVSVAWPQAVALCALAAILALDETAFAQTWFGQPLPAALLAGVVCGDPQTGLVIGLVVQLVVLANLPVGQTFVGDAGTAAVAAVGAAKLQGLAWILRSGLDDPASLARLGWLLLGVLLLSVAGNQVLLAERQAHVLWMLQGHRTLRDGSLARIERLQIRCLAATLVRGFILCLCYLLLLQYLWFPLADLLPTAVMQAVALTPVLAVAVGLGGLIEHFGCRVCLRWLAAGLVCALLTGTVLL